MDEIKTGKLIIIGGAEDKKDKCVILREVIKLSGGENGRIVVMTTATEKPQDVGKNYVEIFKRLGAGIVETVNIDSRNDAKDEIALEKLKKSTCIFFTGGDQLRITSILGGSGVDKLLNELNKRKGTVIVGTSAGASAMSGTMIIGGDDEEAPRKCTINMASGLGLLNNVIIDQHFAQRGRIGRLLTAIAENPNNLGVGIDEDTAIVVDGDKFKVIGSNAVTVVDGRTLKNTNVSESSPDEILSLTHVTLHILPSGYGFDIMLREPFKYNEEDK